MRPIAVEETPSKFPGTCSKCLTANRTYFVDTGMDMEYGGVLYLCNTCMEDLINHVPGFYTQEKVDKIVEASSDMVAKALETQDKVDKILSVLTAIGIDTTVLLERAHAQFNAIQTNENLVQEIESLTYTISTKDGSIHSLQKRVEELKVFEDSPRLFAEKNEHIYELVSKIDKLEKDMKDHEETILRLMQERDIMISEKTQREMEEKEAEVLEKFSMSIPGVTK